MTTRVDSSPPPAYTKKPAPRRPTPDITILVLGSPGVGKSTFISALQHVRNGRLQRPEFHASTQKLAPNPASFAVTLFNRPYNIVLHRSESTLFIDPFPNKIDFAIFCYSIDSRESLYNCQFYWRKQFSDWYERERGLTVPIMLVGLRRDLRTDEVRFVDGIASVADLGGKQVGEQKLHGNLDDSTKRKEFICVLPHEGVKAAQEMQCDKYGECSALTGELMWEVLEDITRTAALTTTEKGGFSESQCLTM